MRVRTLLSVAALLGLSAASASGEPADRAAAADAKKAHDAEVKSALEAFKKAFRGGELEKAEAVKGLAEVTDRKIVVQLASVLGDPGPNVRIAAAEILAAYLKDAVAAQALAKALAATKKQPQVQTAYLDALGRIRDYASAPAVVDQFDDVDLDVTRAAMRAAGDIRAPAFIPELIEFLDDASGGGAATKAASIAEWQARRAALRIAAGLALVKITGERFADVKTWKDWWKTDGPRVTAELMKEDAEERKRIDQEKKAGR